MKTLTTTVLILLSFSSFGQKNYKEYSVCTSSKIHKGKVNHGKSYCVGWATIREYKDGEKDTVGMSFSGDSFLSSTYKEYEKLSNRGRDIVDSLREDGISELQNNYLTYEPHYMKTGKKTEQFWVISGEKIMIYEYVLWNNSKGSGIELINTKEVK